MKQTIEVVYDGEVLRPAEPIELEPNTRYRVTIERATEPEQPTALERILALAQDLGVADLAEQHDHYLYGTPKR